MDSVVKQIAKELADAMGAAVGGDPRIDACREKARASGYEVRVALEAVVSFVSLTPTAPGLRPSGRRAPSRTPPDVTAYDKRFLKSLRIAADETAGKEAE